MHLCVCSAGSIIGLVLGLLCGLFLGLCIAVFFFRRRLVELFFFFLVADQLQHVEYCQLWAFEGLAQCKDEDKVFTKQYNRYNVECLCLKNN